MQHTGNTITGAWRPLALSLAIAATCGLSAAHAQTSSPVPSNRSGVAHMQGILDAIKAGDVTAMPAGTQRAVETGAEAANKSSNLSAASPQTIEFTRRQAENFEHLAREAYVAAMPPRDRARGAALLLGDGTLPGNQGRLYVFVSRSMPIPLLRAYAVEALYTGATLVTKGVRKGDTIKEYVEETVADFNNADGQHMAGMEVNPNLFDMFQVKVVPTVVWTNRVGLDDIGAGCSDLPEGTQVPQIELMGPYDVPMTVNKPVCAPVPESSYYKIAGALKLEYVLDRFEQAGLAKESLAPFREGLKERTGNVFSDLSNQQPQIGNEMQPVSDNLKLDMLPKYVLREWKSMLATDNVQRGPYGPAFGQDGEDDPDYRRELQNIIDHGLGL